MTISAFAPGPAAAAALLAGFAFGLAYFIMLRRTVDLFATGRSRLMPAVLTVGRLGAAILFLAIATKSGALPLLGGFMGFLLARAAALRALRV
jgi:hypothetical protein